MGVLLGYIWELRAKQTKILHEEKKQKVNKNYEFLCVLSIHGEHYPQNRSCKKCCKLVGPGWFTVLVFEIFLSNDYIYESLVLQSWLAVLSAVVSMLSQFHWSKNPENSGKSAKAQIQNSRFPKMAQQNLISIYFKPPLIDETLRSMLSVKH